MQETMPSAVRMEQVLLGAILLDERAMQTCREADLKADEFYLPAHQNIYSVMEGLASKGKPLDIASVVQSLEENGNLEESGGMKYIGELMDASYTGIMAESYVGTIQEKAQLRRLIDTAGEITQEAHNSAEEIDAILDNAERSIMAVTRTRRGSEFQTFKEVIHSVSDELDNLRNSKGVSGIRTGYTDFDRMTSGLHPGELLILAARPAMGKSAFALNLANQVARRNKGTAVAVFSLEMPAESLVKRLISCESGVDGNKLISGKLDETDLANYNEAISRIQDRNIFIDDTSQIKVAQIFSKCRKLKSQMGQISLVVIDYLQLISGSGRSDSRQQEVSEISRNLKILAKELECPVLALSQLSRKVEERTNHEPQLSDLRESGSIEQDADIVMFLYREAYYNPNENDSDHEEVDLALKKHRNGETGTVKLTFTKNLSRFDSFGGSI